MKRRGQEEGEEKDEGREGEEEEEVWGGGREKEKPMQQCLSLELRVINVKLLSLSPPLLPALLPPA